MFRSARLKLTGWYLLITLFVSISFSVVIYSVITNEVERFAHAQQFRFERRMRTSEVAPFTAKEFPPELLQESEFVAETEQRVAITLIFINVGILVLAGGFGYFLAGRTLSPIQVMVDEQARFISDASHEFRTPLTALKTSLEVHLRDTHLTLSDAKVVLTHSVTEVNKLQSLTDALLQLTYQQDSQAIQLFTQISLVNISQTAVQNIGLIAKNKKVEIINKITQKNLTIDGEKNNLIGLFVILLENAIKYSPIGSKILLTAAKTNGKIKIAIQDHGIGIQPKDLPYIFDRFYRADMARSKSGADGYGLGLSIAQRIVRMHHGSIHVMSKPGKGSTFIVLLPIKHSASFQLGILHSNHE